MDLVQVIKLKVNWAIYIGKTKKMTLVQTNIWKISDKSALCAKKIFPENCVTNKSEAESVLSNVLKIWKISAQACL